MQFGAVFLDLKKAFDTFNHQVLSSKLTHFNFSEETILWMKSYPSHRKQCDCVDWTKSPDLYCPVGVPQGSIFSNFIIYIYLMHVKEMHFQIMQIMLYTFKKPFLILTSAMTHLISFIEYQKNRGGSWHSKWVQLSWDLHWPSKVIWKTCQHYNLIYKI